MENIIEIPEGYEARIDGNKIILEPKESEDETIRKELIGFIQDEIDSINRLVSGDYDDRDADDITHQKWCEKVLAWIKKQGEHSQNPYSGVSFTYNGHTWGMCARDNGVEILIDGQLKSRVFADCKVEPKFKVGDWVVFLSSNTLQIVKIDLTSNYYWFNDGSFLAIVDEDCLRPWTIEDAKDGDVLAEHESIVLFKKIEGLNIKCYCTYHYLGFDPTFYVDTLQNKTPYRPATKELRDKLEKAITKAGYKWDAEKKELNKIEQNPTWSEEDERVKQDIENLIHFALRDGSAVSPGADTTKEGALGWLKSFKERYTWKPSDEQITQLSKYCPDNRPLTSLYNDLKKLKG